MASTTKTWLNNNPPTVDDDDLNGFKAENNNLISGSGQILDTGDNQQTHKAVANYVASGDFYTDSGVADAYVLSVVGAKTAPTSYHVGMRVRFIPGNDNTGASTINVAGLGVKSIVDEDGTALIGGEILQDIGAELVYDGTNFVKKVFLEGVPQADELRGKRIGIVAGTLRQDPTTRTNWNWIKDANHEPVGVDDSTPAVASGSELTINYLKTYTRVLSYIAAPDESFANALGMSVGGSVGLSLTVLKVSINQTISAHINFNGATWDVLYGTGQGGTSNFNVNISSVAYAGGNLTIDHERCAGTDLTLIAHTDGGAVIPFLPCIKSQTNVQAIVNFIDLGSPAVLYNGAASTKMSFQFNKVFRGGALLDGTSGSEVHDFDLGNIWFFGIFEI